MNGSVSDYWVKVYHHVVFKREKSLIKWIYYRLAVKGWGNISWVGNKRKGNRKTVQ